MTTETFKLPDVGEGLTEADILAWHVAVGDEVRVNQTLVEVETAKAAVELPCPFDGVVAELLAGEGDTVAVGSPIIAVMTGPEKPGDDDTTENAISTTEADPAHQADDGQAAATAEGSGSVLVGYGTSTARTERRRRRPASPEPEKSPAPEADKVAAGGAQTLSSAPRGDRGRPPATPPVRKMAKDLGVDLAEVPFDGDRIRRDDIRRHLDDAVISSNGAAASAVEPEETTTAKDTDPGSSQERRVPIKGVRHS